MIEKILRGTLLTALFAIPFIPLIIIESMFFPYIVGKNFAFRLLVEIAGAAWVGLALIDERYRPKKSLIWTLSGAFVLVVLVADLLGISPAKSIWSNFERMEGWVTLAHLFVLLTAMYSVLTRELWNRFFYTTLGASTLIALYGLLQALGLATISTQSGYRVDATFGNATYTAVYMMFHLFFIALVWERLWREGIAGRLTHIFFTALLVLHGVVLFLTATRGAVLGAVIGAAVASAMLMIGASSSRNAWRASAAVLGVILVGSLGFYMARNTSLVQNSEALRRLTNISLTESTISARFMNWGMAWEGVKQRPLLGWGQENYNVVFNQNYNPNMYAQEQWFDRVHNVIFDWLIAAGIVGLLLYLSIIAAVLYGIWFSGAFLIAERSILTGLVAAYTFQNMAVFDNLTSSILWFVLVGYVAYRVADHAQALPVVKMVPVDKKFHMAVGVATVLLVWGVGWYVNAAPLAKNRALLQAAIPQSTPEQNLELFKAAVAVQSPIGEQELREQLIQFAARVQQSQVTPETKAAFAALALEEMQKQASAAPGDARFPFFLGMLYQVMGNKAEAITSYEKAVELSPNKQSMLYQLGKAYLDAGRIPEGVAQFKKAFELAPQNEEARNIYAAIAIQTQQFAIADELLAPFIAEARAPDARVISAYAQQGKYEPLIAMWTKRIAAEPQDAQARFALAATYYSAGKKADAVKTLEQAARDIPETAVQAAQYIEEIKNGKATKR
jgi:tetratricopeptide (TPR) repeat protein/O-antigen ligase